MVLQLKEGKLHEYGKDTGIFLEEAIIKIVAVTFYENQAALTLLNFQSEEVMNKGGAAFSKSTIQLSKDDLTKLKEDLGDIFILQENSVFLCPDNVNNLMNRLKIGDVVIGDNYERKIS